MKTSLRLLLSLTAALLLTNCVALDDPYYGGSYSSGYTTSYPSGGGYYNGPDYYDSRPYYSGGGGYYNRPSYYGGSSYVCPRCHRNPCSCGYRGGSSGHYDHDHDHDDYRRSNSNNKSSSSSNGNRSTSGQKKDSSGGLLYKYGSSRNGAPEGNHTKDWYAERGYDLKKLKPTR